MLITSPENLESLAETKAILSDPDAMAEIDEARRGIAKGDVVDVATVRMRPRT
jgi:PHD/YefM family antitoxin component YafN of YafNO toxin-antitoxin module